MIISDGTQILVSRKEGETSGILFPAISFEDEPILAMAVGVNSFALGESFTSDNALDEDVVLSPSEFAKEAKALGIVKPVLVTLIPDGKTVAFNVPEGSQWNQITANGTKLVIVFDDDSVSVVDNIHPAVAPGMTAVVTAYATYARHNDALPNTYDLFDAYTGELIQNVSI